MSKHIGGRGKRGYHHGDLKNALMDAARRLISEKGPMGFTIAEAARLAGVSPSAPYRHFRDRDQLLEDVALAGFIDFAAGLEAARRDPALTPLQALDAVGRTYLSFAQARPADFSAMFEAGVSHGSNPALREASDRAFAALTLAVEAVAAQMPLEKRPPTLMVARHIWALSHGVATLFGRADAGRRQSPVSAEELLEAGVGVYLRGLGVIPDL
ncbi:MAG: TetR/AcrR family transcriptional regulator [Rhodobacteraceae bacterium]|nr:TetR/AcrR family transcriptional regulator [Paracoccaceae bacterium]